jgi:protein-disulfide isomerase
VDAPITIVEFTDIQCGFCKRFHQQAFAEIREKLILTGKVRFVSRDFPLDFSSFSVQAAEAVRCAGEQGKYWPLRDMVMSAGGPVDAERLNEMARNAGVDVPKMNACVDTHKYRPAIEADMKEGVRLNVAGTPSFVIGRSTPEGVEGVTMVGAQGFEAFAAKIREVEGKK